MRLDSGSGYWLCGNYWESYILSDDELRERLGLPADAIVMSVHPVAHSTESVISVIRTKEKNLSAV